MAKIECKLGPTDQTVAGTSYSFQLDRYGRAVADVHNERAVECFLSVEHYRIAEDIEPPAPPVVPEKPADDEETVDETDEQQTEKKPTRKRGKG